MRALVITKHGPPEVLKVQERPDPVPGPGEVRIAVKAAGINFADLLARIGLYAEAPKPPCVVGYEVAGELESLGEGVSGMSPGERVISPTRFNGYAEYVVVPADFVLPLPESWSFEEGAALPVVYGTAYAGLARFGSLRPDERLLVQAAAGGVGIAATQIAKSIGAEVFGTASASKHAAIRSFGVDHPIDYREQDFVKEVRRITGSRHPLDVVLDGIGGKSFRRSYSLLRPGGRLVCIGASSVMRGERRDLTAAVKALAQTPRFNALRMMSESRGVIGLNMLKLWDDRGSLREYSEPLTGLIQSGAVRPVVAEAFPLERGAEAHRFLAERRNTGKVVLTL